MTELGILQLIPKVMKSVGAIRKDRENEFQRYKYRGISDALSHVQPALVEHGVTPQVEFFDCELRADGPITVCRLGIRLTLWAPDGSSMTNVAFGEARDKNGDKATNKAMSAAMKYGLFMGLCIPDENLADSDADPKTEEPAKSPPKKKAAKKTSGRRTKNEPPPGDLFPPADAKMTTQQRAKILATFKDFRPESDQGMSFLRYVSWLKWHGQHVPIDKMSTTMITKTQANELIEAMQDPEKMGRMLSTWDNWEN